MKDFMVLSFTTQNKGSLKGNVTLLIPAWGDFVITGITYFEKDGKRWVAFPNRSYKDGMETRWEPIVYFQEKGMMGKFSEKVLKAIDDYLGVKF